MKKYEELFNKLVFEIEENRIKIGDKLPSESDILGQYNYSRITVRKAIDLLESEGYIEKSQGKQSLVVNNQRRKKTVLLVVPYLFDYIFAEIIVAIEQVLNVNDLTMLIGYTYNDHNREVDLLKNHLDTVDAIIIEPCQTHLYESLNPIYEKLKSIPTVTINAKLSLEEITSVILDDYDVMHKLSVKLIESGIESVVAIYKTDDTQGYERLRAIEDVIDANKGIKLHTIKFSTDSKETVIDDAIKFYADYSPKCMMFYNDQYASMFIDAATRLNLDISDMIITGFDGTSLSDNSLKKFISPIHPKEKMGNDVANILVDKINNKNVDSLKYKVDIKNMNLLTSKK